MNSCMKHVIFIVCVSLVLLQGVAFSSENITAATNPTNTTTTTLATTATSPSNDTLEDKRDFLDPTDTSGMLQRSLYVAIGISTLVALYFIVRTVKTRGRRKAKKYGVIHGTGEQELQPLDKHVDEDEEDMTLFDVKDAKRPK